jgi:hypothetical protein
MVVLAGLPSCKAQMADGKFHPDGEYLQSKKYVMLVSHAGLLHGLQDFHHHQNWTKLEGCSKSRSEYQIQLQD